MAITSEKVQHDDGMITYRKICTTRKEAIRVFCMECFGMSRLEPMPKTYGYDDIKNCPDLDCPLHPYRLGENPFRKKRTLSPEHKEKLILARQKSQIENSRK